MSHYFNYSFFQWHIGALLATEFVCDPINIVHQTAGYWSIVIELTCPHGFIASWLDGTDHVVVAYDHVMVSYKPWLVVILTRIKKCKNDDTDSKRIYQNCKLSENLAGCHRQGFTDKKTLRLFLTVHHGPSMNPWLAKVYLASLSSLLKHRANMKGRDCYSLWLIAYEP